MQTLNLRAGTALIASCSGEQQATGVGDRDLPRCTSSVTHRAHRVSSSHLSITTTRRSLIHHPDTECSPLWLHRMSSAHSLLVVLRGIIAIYDVFMYSTAGPRLGAPRFGSSGCKLTVLRSFCNLISLEHNTGDFLKVLWWFPPQTELSNTSQEPWCVRFSPKEDHLTERSSFIISVLSF